jgi:hypothetical protein
LEKDLPKFTISITVQLILFYPGFLRAFIQAYTKIAAHKTVIAPSITGKDILPNIW